jgi:hypothetical protein
MGSWLRETLRGESEFVNQSMEHLKTRLHRDVARYRVPLIVNVLILEKNDRRLFGGFSNLSFNTALKRTEVLPTFEYLMQEVDTTFMFANGAGAARAHAKGYLARIEDQLSVWPNEVTDHMNLLATINRKVSAKTNTVSPHCHVSFLNADERTEPTFREFLEPGEQPLPFSMPMLLVKHIRPSRTDTRSEQLLARIRFSFRIGRQGKRESGPSRAPNSTEVFVDRAMNRSLTRRLWSRPGNCAFAAVST